MVADRCREPDVWSSDATATPTAGVPAVGVARPACGTQGKVIHGHVAVSVPWRHPASRGPLTWRLDVPQAWRPTRPWAAHVTWSPRPPYRQRTDVALALLAQVWS
jgi:hypothetical protein